MTQIRLIGRTAEATMPWPEDTLINGSNEYSGVREGKSFFNDAFVEVYVDGTLIRADALTLVDAENLAWEKYQKRLNCPGHEYETRGYTNGAGFCKKCNRFQSHVFTGEELNQFCCICGKGTTDASYTDQAYWDTKWGSPRDPGKEDDLTRKWYCKNDDPFRADWEREHAKEEVVDFSSEKFAETLKSVVNALSVLPAESRIDSAEETAAKVAELRAKKDASE